MGESQRLTAISLPEDEAYHLVKNVELVGVSSRTSDSSLNQWRTDGRTSLLGTLRVGVHCFYSHFPELCRLPFIFTRTHFLYSCFCETQRGSLKTVERMARFWINVRYMLEDQT